MTTITGNVRNTVGNPVDIIPVTQVDINGNALNAAPVQLASNITVNANSGTGPSSIGAGGSFLWDVQFTGTSIKLQALGSDGTTWRDVATAASSGVTGVVLGGNAVVRLYNPNGGNDTAVWSSLS